MMDRPSHPTSNNQASSLRVATLLAISLATAWVWLVAGTRLHEMIVGVVAVSMATAFLLLVHKSQRNAISLHWHDVLQGWRVPWYLVSGMWEITIVLVKDLLYVQRAGSYYRVCGFKSSKRDKTLLTREILAIVYNTAAPNFIVIGIDPELSRMLFHQISRTRVPRMTQALGAQP